MRKTTALLLVLSLLTVSNVIVGTRIAPMVEAQTEISPTAYIKLNTGTVEFGQGVNVEMWIEPAQPTPNDGIRGTLKVTRPDGIIDSFDLPTYSQRINLTWAYLPNQVGNFSFQFIYPGGSFSNGAIIYQFALSPVVTLTVLGTPRPQMETPSGSWTQKASMQQARGHLSVAAVNDKIYAIGGSTESGIYPPDILGSFTGTNEEYDPAIDNWTSKKPMPTRRDSFAIAACQGKIYCIGGIIGTEKVDVVYSRYVLTSVNEVYDPATNTWETKAPMPEDSAFLTANVVNGKIYMVSGKTIFIYEPAEDSWSTKDIRTGALDYSVSAVVDARIYFLSESSKRLSIYDVKNDSWSQGVPAPAIAIDGPVVATTGVLVPKRVYVLGVAPYVSYLDSSTAPASRRVTYVYDIESDSWLAGAVMPTYRLDFGVAVVNDTLFVVGGYTLNDARGNSGVTARALNEQYVPARFGTVPPGVSIISPENKTYAASNVTLTFVVDRPVVWMGYSLDGLEDVTVTGNTAIADLPNGLHNVTVYANDTFGNMGASETISFTVAVPEPFPVLPVAAASTVVAVAAGVGLLFYFKKRKH